MLMAAAMVQADQVAVPAVVAPRVAAVIPRAAQAVVIPRAVRAAVIPRAAQAAVTQRAAQAAVTQRPLRKVAVPQPTLVTSLNLRLPPAALSTRAGPSTFLSSTAAVTATIHKIRKPTGDAFTGGDYSVSSRIDQNQPRCLANLSRSGFMGLGRNFRPHEV